MVSPVASGPDSIKRVRLHITPFNHDLVERFLPASLRSQASGISFHAVQTFPERGFGYVELPIMEAQKLKKKFGGTTLKGTKIRIEEAKAEKKRKIDQVPEAGEEQVQRKVKRDRKKREDGVLLGHELEESRIVQRGWADDASARKGKKDKKYATKSLKDKKMQFKTTLPRSGSATATKDLKGGKKTKDKKMKNGKVDTVIKEFSKTLRLNAPISKASELPTVAYEDGKGWLDKNGDVVEAEPASRARQRAQGALITSPVPGIEHEEPTSKSTSSEDVEAVDSGHVTDSSSDSSSDDTSSAATSESEALSSSDDNEDNSLSENSAQQPERASRPILESASQALAKEVHPLEALYKRPKPENDTAPVKRPAPINTSFSFFGSVNDEDARSNDVDRQLPQTPHTKKDLEWRSIRSAAPTPDTAAAGKRFSFALGGDYAANEYEDEDEDAPYHSDTYTPKDSAVKSNEGVQREESEFRKWFYENRGDLNRGWKKRRREERKLERQRENRRLGRKVA